MKHIFISLMFLSMLPGGEVNGSGGPDDDLTADTLEDETDEQKPKKEHPDNFGKQRSEEAHTRNEERKAGREPKPGEAGAE